MKRITKLIFSFILLLSLFGIIHQTTYADTTDTINNWHEVVLPSGTKIKISPNSYSRLSGKVNYDNQTYNYKFVLNNGNYILYLNNEKVASWDINNSQILPQSNNFSPFINFTYANGKVAFKHAGRKYYYLTTEKYSGNTLRKLNNATRDIIIGLAGFIPVVGPYISGASLGYTIYNDIFGKNPKNKWYTVKEYCTRGYEYYAWKVYTYKDSSRKHLQSIHWEYKKVL